MSIFTLNSCTIEVPKGGQSAKATRHAEGKTPEVAEFKVLGIDGAPTPQVQATRWALGMPAWLPPAPATSNAAPVVLNEETKAAEPLDQPPEKPKGKK